MPNSSLESPILTNKFVSIGECMAEMAPTAEGTYRLGFAGDTLNTAWYARRLLGAAWDVFYLTAVGEDPISGQMLTFFSDAGIRTDFVRRLKDRTVGLYLIQLQDGERSFAYWRSNSAARQLAADPALLASALEGAGLVYFSGITLAILSDGERSRLLDSIRSAREKGAKVAFDPNLRPQLWETPDAMRRWIMAAAEVCDIALPSYEDETAFFGDRSPAETARRYAEAGVTLVVVKNGPADILYLQEGTERTVSAPKAEDVVDTTAAGDSFNAGFLSAYLTGSDVVSAISAGASLAAKVIGRRGALVDCTPAEM